MFKRIQIILQYILPHHSLSRFMGAIANCKKPWFKNRLICWFINSYQVDLSLAKSENVNDYVSFNDFFTRELKKGARPVSRDSKTIASPVDGWVSEFGLIHDQDIFQAKGFYYQLDQLLGKSQFSNYFVDGNFVTLYLSPSDYHRVHMPITGTLLEMTYVPGKLFSVNPLYVQSIPHLFTRNERVVSIFKTEIGFMAVVLVGAMIVGSVRTVWSGKVTQNQINKIQSVDYSSQEIKLTRGEELGHFEFGSTVVVLFEKDKMNLDEQLNQAMKIQMGQEIGRIIK